MTDMVVAYIENQWVMNNGVSGKEEGVWKRISYISFLLEKRNGLFIAFVDLEKGYDIVKEVLYGGHYTCMEYKNGQ